MFTFWRVKRIKRALTLQNVQSKVHEIS